MTDREMLIKVQADISKHLGTSCPPEVPVDPTPPAGPVIIPPSKSGSPPKGNWDGWLWPVPHWNGEAPKISDNFKRHEKDGHRQHLGADIMFRNPSKMKRNIPENTPWYHMPSDTVPMLAMGPGHVWFAGKTTTGYTVKIDHHNLAGFALITYYTHMSELFIPEHDGPDGMEVFPGMQLGFVGNSPKGPSDPNHCHMEMWDYDVGGPRVQRAMDPGKYLPYFGQLVLPQPKVGLRL